MAYNNAIPQASDSLSQSQADLLENFATISALLGVDHVISPWTSPATGNQGKHNKVTLPEQSSDPTTAANEMALYTKAVSGVTQLFLAPEGAGTVRDITSKSWSGSQGSTTLPSGLIIKWGKGTASAGGFLDVNFTTPFNTIYTCYATNSLAVGASGLAVGSRIYTYSNAVLRISTYLTNTGTVGAYDVHWFAIGV